MCTVTFFPTAQGYVVAMNRDDLYARSGTRPPAVVASGNRKALFPSEEGGGTWIGTNDVGLTLCVLNWHIPAGAKVRTRGEAIPQLLASGSLDEVESGLTTDRLRGMLPFRLLGFSNKEREIVEWRWDGNSKADALRFAWKVNHWFSSGRSDEQACIHRIPVCKAALAEPDALSMEWVRRLHRSHDPERGTFTICAHRPDAGTLSYTEIVVSLDETQMSYSDASPCMQKPLATFALAHAHVQFHNR